MEENINSQAAESVEKTVAKNIGDTIAASELIQIMLKSEANTKSKKPLTAQELRTALDLFKNAVIQEVGKGHRVQLNGFLSFVVSYRPARKGNNVFTRQPMDIPEGVQIAAKIGSLVRNAIKDFTPEAIQEFKALSNKSKTTSE